MAGYTITVNFNDTSGDKGYEAISKKPAEEVVESGLFETIENKISDSAFSFVTNGVIAFAGINAVKQVAEIGKELFSREIQRVGRYTGSQQAQNIANATMSVIGKLARPISSIIDLVYEIDQSNYEKNWESIGLQLYRERAGSPINRSRSER